MNQTPEFESHALQVHKHISMTESQQTLGPPKMVEIFQQYKTRSL